MNGGDPLILESARRHDIDDADILHAYRNPIRVLHMDEMTLLIGPSRDGTLLEVGVSEYLGTTRVFHAMRARRRYLPGLR